MVNLGAKMYIGGDGVSEQRGFKGKAAPAASAAALAHLTGWLLRKFYDAWKDSDLRKSSSWADILMSLALDLVGGILIAEGLPTIGGGFCACSGFAFGIPGVANANRGANADAVQIDDSFIKGISGELVKALNPAFKDQDVRNKSGNLVSLNPASIADMLRQRLQAGQISVVA